MSNKEEISGLLADIEKEFSRISFANENIGEAHPWACRGITDNGTVVIVLVAGSTQEAHGRAKVAISTLIDGCAAKGDKK